MKNNLVCDECEKEFVIVDKKHKYPKGIEENYFTCPHCSEEYVFLVTDAALRKEQKRIKKLSERYITSRNKATIRSDQLMEQLNQMKTDNIINNAMNSVDETLEDWRPIK